MVSILCTGEKRQALSELLYSETTALGLRVRQVDRECLPREFIKVKTKYGELDVKIARFAEQITNAMPEYEFAIELTVPDNTAFTVLTALRGLGYRELERVERADLLRLRLRENAMSVDECARSLLRAEIVFNPNKHRLTYARAGTASTAEAIVVDKDDDASALCELLSASNAQPHGVSSSRQDRPTRSASSGHAACCSPIRIRRRLRCAIVRPTSPPSGRV